MNKQTHKRTSESPPVFYKTSSPSGPLPKRPHLRLPRAECKLERADHGAGRADYGFKQVAQGRYVVSDDRCPALNDCKLEWEEAGQRCSDPEGDKVL